MPVPQITITPAGFDALVNDEHTGTKVVKITHIGLTATHFDVNAVGAALPGEHKRLTTFGGKAVAADTLHLNIRDDGPDTYTMRGFGLYLQDGTLFAVYSQATAIMEKAAAATLLLATDIRFSKITATSIEVGDVDFINPPATTTQVGVVRFSTDQEADAGSDQTTAITPRGLFRYINARFGADAPSAFVKTLLGAATAAIFRTSLGLKSAALRDEGHGNGLNADLLDGEQGTYYLDFRNSTNLPTSWNPTAHTHTIGQVDGLVDALNAKANLSGASFVGEVSASKVTSRSNHFYGGQTYAVLNPSATGGVCMLRPDGASSTTGELVVATAAITWDGKGIWHAGNFNPATKANLSGATFTGMVVSQAGFRAAGWGSTPTDGTMYFGAGDSYIYKAGARFTFRNVEGDFTAALLSGGDIWTSGNFNPATKANLTGATFTGSLGMSGSGARIKLFDDNHDVANIEIVAGHGSGTDRHGVIINRNPTGALALLGRNGGSQLTLGSADGVTTLSGRLVVNVVETFAPPADGYSEYKTHNGGALFQCGANNPVYGNHSVNVGAITNVPVNILQNNALRLAFSSASSAFYTSVSATGGFDFGSSRKLKDIDGAMPYGLAEVRRIATLIGRYKPGYNDDGRTRLFFDAEQFAEVMPEAVDLEGVEFEGERVASMKLDQTLPPAYRAIAQLAELVDSLRLEVAALQEGR